MCPYTPEATIWRHCTMGPRHITAAVALALCVTACGSSTAPPKTQAQIQACWTTHATAYAKQYAQSITTSPATQPSLEQMVLSAVPLYEARTLPSSMTTPAITAHLKAIEATCGKLR